MSLFPEHAPTRLATLSDLGLAGEASDLGWRRQTGRTTADVYWLAQGGAVMVWGPAASPGEWWAWQGASDATRHETERDALMAAMAAWGVA